MPASEQGHMGRKGISYSPTRGINASGVRLTPASSLAYSRMLQLKSTLISAWETDVCGWLLNKQSVVGAS